MCSRIPILSYHAIVADGKNPAPFWSPYHTISLTTLRQQLNTLKAGGWRVVPLQALAQPALPPTSVAITFDDGASSDLVAAEELHRQGVPATFFVTWSRLGCPWFLAPNQVVELCELGFTIGSHGMSHVRFAQLTPAELHYELAGSKERLENLLGKPVTALALPFGSYDDTVVAAAVAAGYRWIMTSDFALAAAGSYVLPRLAILARQTTEDFRGLLTHSRVRIARRRVVNAIRRRWNRLRPNGDLMRLKTGTD
jgi:peptidoglycan/xylan/chitin deacetylase (PgdA/CDA1 family)